MEQTWQLEAGRSVPRLLVMAQLPVVAQPETQRFEAVALVPERLGAERLVAERLGAERLEAEQLEWVQRDSERARFAAERAAQEERYQKTQPAGQGLPSAPE
jgi:hypothetical protein